MGERASVSLTHVGCEGTGPDGDIFHLLPLRALSGNPEPAWSCNIHPLPSISGLSVKSSLLATGIYPAVLLGAAPHPSNNERVQDSQGRLKCQQHIAASLSSANGRVSCDVAGMVCNVA